MFAILDSTGQNAKLKFFTEKVLTKLQKICQLLKREL